MQIRGIFPNQSDRTVSSVTRIIRTTNNNIFPQKVLTEEMLNNMDKQCQMGANVYNLEPPLAPPTGPIMNGMGGCSDDCQKTHHCCDSSCSTDCCSCCPCCSCFLQKFKFLCDYLTLPVWLTILIGTLLSLAILALLLAFILYVGLGKKVSFLKCVRKGGVGLDFIFPTLKKPATIRFNCTNVTVYNSDYQYMDQVATNCGNNYCECSYFGSF
jgi:hypothetical protein